MGGGAKSAAIAAVIGLGSCGFREIPSEPACFEYVVASDTHSCGRKTDGTLWCWGNNQHGQLGTGDTASQVAPVRVDPEGLGSDVAGVYVPSGSGGISTRTAFTCARKTDGTLWCWGSNEYGQLGTGDRDARLRPTQVTGLGTDVHAASLGGAFGCARKTDNTLWCWGANEAGQLGTGDKQDRLSPVEVDPSGLGASVRRFSTGAAHTCARRTDNTLYCWGANEAGQLGTGDTELAMSPTRVDTSSLGATADVVVTGAAHTCVTLSDTAIDCFGANQFGQLGLGADPSPRLHPERVDLPGFAGGVPMITAGGRHTCAGKTDGSLWCWGDNRAGQLGVGTRANSGVPVQVDAAGMGAQVAVVYAGGAHTCVRNIDNSVWCWGSNEYGQLGIGAGPGSEVPVQVAPSCP